MHWSGLKQVCGGLQSTVTAARCNRYTGPMRPLRMSISVKIRQAKIVSFVDKFGEVIGDRTLKHIKSSENICFWAK